MIRRSSAYTEIPIGFAEDVVQGMSVRGLCEKYTLSWRVCHRYIESDEVKSDVAEMKAALRAHAIRTLERAQSVAAERLIELIQQNRDPKVALEACRLALGIQGHTVTDRQEVTVSSPATSLSDDELAARLARLRAAHPMVIEVQDAASAAEVDDEAERG